MPVLGPAGRHSGSVLRVSGVRQGPLTVPRSSVQIPLGVEAAPSSSYAIVNNANTQVLHLGSGVYSVEKISASGAYDADAVSTVGMAGDFVLRLKNISNGSPVNAWLAGVNSDPLTDSNFTSIDYAFLYNQTSGQWGIYENGGAVAVNLGNDTYAWIWRAGTTLGYGRGADLATAKAAPDRTQTTSATLYFDCSIDPLGSQFEVYLYDPPVGGTIYTLTADPAATFTMSGQSATLSAQRKLSATAGSFALTGQSAALKAQRKLSATAGIFTLTGQNAALKTQRKLTATAGSFALSGQTAALKAQRRLTATAGSFTMSGQSAGLNRQRLLVAQLASFSLTGQTASLRAGRNLSATPGSYSLTGQNAQLTKSVVLSAFAAAFTMSGQNASLRAQRLLTATVGSYAMSGQNINLLKSRFLTATLATYALTTNNVILGYTGGGGGSVASVRVVAVFMRP